jgi:chemosensory pili system protein ChpA (sensor histidine kinase/response regulator)
MKLQDDIDFTTLNWVKQELDETLKQARQALEAYVEDPADASLMRFCATYLHQVQGTLRMVELYGAAMVVEEMERVALGLLDGQIKPHDETYSVLMRGIVQLPDYLERLQSGHKDIPIVLLPLLNDLRATRGEKLLTESVLFSPDLSAPLPGSAAGPQAALSAIDLRAEAARLRSAFQLALLRWIRDESSSEHLDRLTVILDKLRDACSQEDARRLWWVATGVLESVSAGTLEASVAVKLLFGKVDREIKRLVDMGEAGFAESPPRELTKNLLYYIAHSTAHGPRATEVRETYKLDTLLPSEKELEHAKGSISGHNRTLLDTVSAAIKDDLLRVKEALDIFLRANNSDPGDLSAQAEVLDRVGDTLGMLGLGVPRRVVTEQRQMIQEIAAKSRPADETTLLDVAGALLYVEASLDDHIQRLGADSGASAQGDGPIALELPKAEVRKILDALMKEASVNISQVKQDIVAFVESPWDHARVEQIPRLLEEISGALRMLDLAQPAKLMTGIVRFVEIELLRHRRVPTVEQMDKLADALASLEYYIEGTREQRGGREQILDVTRRSLEALGYWPVPEDHGGGGGPFNDTPEPPPGGGTEKPRQTSSDSVTATGLSFASASSAATVAQSDGLTIAQDDADRLHIADSGFPDWNDHLPTSGEASLSMESDAGQTHGDHLPSIELPPDESIDDFLARIDRGEHESPAVAHEERVPEMRSVDLRSAVDIAPGDGLEDLVIGETHLHERASHDVSGLRLTETELTAPQSVRYVEIEEEIEEEVPDVEDGATFADASFQTHASDEIDAEIREVFVEEVQEEIENLKRNLPMWRAEPADFERLKPIRRSFHTLKGSGRLVGALALGDFSWKVENMLNRVLDKTIQPSVAMQTLTAQSIDVLPELLSALRGDGSPKSDIGAIMKAADQLAAGEEAWVKSGSTVRMKKVKRIVKRMVPVAMEAAPADRVEAPVELTEAVDLLTPISSGDEEILHAFEMPADAFTAEIDAPSPHQTSASSLANVDPLLFDILKSEVAAHLSVIDAYTDEARTLATPASEPLLRAVHTLNGAIAMVEIPTITQVLAPLENYIKRLRAGNQAPNVAGLDALAECSTLVRSSIVALEAVHPQMPQSDALAATICQLRDALPEPEMMHTLFSADDAPAIESTPVESIESVIAEFANEEVSADRPLQEFSAPATSEQDSDAALLAALAALEEAESASTSDSSTYARALDTSGPADEEIILGGDQQNDDLTAALIKQQLEDERIAEEERVAEEESARKRAEEEAAAAEEVSLSEADIIGEAPSEQPDVTDIVEETLEAATLIEAPRSVELDNIVEIAANDTVEEAVAEVPPVVSSKPEPVVAERQPAPESAIELPPLADDPQPEGKLELPEMDEDLLEIFAQEGADILDHSDGLMARLRESPQDREFVMGLQRDLHTLKGGARMAGLAPIGDLSHAMESLLEAISENRRLMDRLTVESLERGFDRLHGLVQRVARRQAIAMPSNAITRFEGLVSGELPALVAPVESKPVPAASQPVAAPVVKAPRVPLRTLPALEEDEVQIRAPQEMIRVRSDLLDSLVNYAGEVSIYRSRLEQQISTFRFNLVEFEQTVSRLRDQLRKLELETEAQILSRYQREQHEAGDTAFDPLELDRFSQLQQLSRALAESVSDLTSIQGLLDDLTRQSETLLLQQSRVSSDLQEGLMRTRMVPFDSLVPNLRRTVRQAATEVGKRAQLKVEGAQGEMDRNLLERMKAPFEHMLRNALAHGVESPDDRVAAGKSAEGNVTIQVSREATEVVLKVSDDGKGLDRDAIRRKAIERGLLKPDVQLSDRDLYGFILETGFSTAETVTQLSGRGVGMDVVHNEIKQLGGSLAIDSNFGKGTSFIIRLPFTLAVTQAILVRLGESVYAVPMSSVQGVVRIAREDLERRMKQADPAYNYAGDEFVIYELSQLLNVPPTRIVEETQLPLLMTRTGDQRAAVRVDAVIGSREIVVKSVGPQISSVPGIFGATIMGDGSVVMILDLAPLVRRSAARRVRVASGELVEAPIPLPILPVHEERRHPLVMVVDDSITMRKVTTRVLERNDMDVITAKDGLDAVEKLQDKVPDVVLLDVEMPRMDGYELATYMKNDPRLRLVPIIMITSRTGEKHRQRALEIGVERYLGKPYQEVDLLRNLQETLRLSRA